MCSRENGVCDIFFTGSLDLIHRSLFPLNFWGESCLFTVLTKVNRSRCSFDAGVHSTLKSGDDVTISQPNACGREDIFQFLVFKKQGFCWCHNITNWCHSWKGPRDWAAKGRRGIWGRMCTAGCIPPCFGRADSEGSPCRACCLPGRLDSTIRLLLVWCLVTLFPTEDKSCARSYRMGKSKSGGWQGRTHHLTC